LREKTRYTRYVAYLHILSLRGNATAGKESDRDTGDGLKTKIALETLPVFDTANERLRMFLK